MIGSPARAYSPSSHVIGSPARAYSPSSHVIGHFCRAANIAAEFETARTAAAAAKSSGDKSKQA
eukprot:2727952-Pyramimonas_sp.AAC.1